MKRRIFSLLAISTLLILASCGDKKEKEPTPDGKLPEISISADPTMVMLTISDSGTITLKATKKVSEDVIVTITNSDPSVIETESTVTIAKNSASATSQFTALKDGSATLTVSYDGEYATISESASSVSIGVSSSSSAIISVATDKNTVASGEKGTVTLTLSQPLTEDTTVPLVSNSEANLSVEESVTFTAGKTTATAEFTGIRRGRAVISPVCDDLDVEPSPVNGYAIIKAEGMPNTATKIISGDWNQSSDQYYEYVKVKLLSSEGDTSGYFILFGMHFHETGWDGTFFDGWRISFDNYGADFVGETKSYGAVMSLLNKDVTINDDLNWLENPDHGWEDLGSDLGDNWMCAPYVWAQDIFTNHSSKNGYLVGSMWYSDSKSGIPYGQYPGWVYVKVTHAAVYMEDFAINVGGGTFKTGQKQ